MAYKIFLDTDVIIDFLVDRRPHAIESSKIFKLSEEGLLSICTSSLCICNVHYIIRKVVGDVKARNIIEKLLELIDVADVTKKNILDALVSDFRDFEDAVQYSVALNEIGVKSIITRNTKDYSSSVISVLNPDLFITIFENEP